MKIASLFLTILFSTAVLADEKPFFKDDFSNTDLKQRRASRGDWKYVNGVATCTQDDALFKKFQDHGPIIFYDLPTTDSTINFSFKPEGVKSVVFTANGEKGHVFRFVLSNDVMSVRAFPPGDAKSIAIGQEKFPLRSGEWVAVEVKLQGNKATVKLGDAFEKSYEHASLSRPKANLSVGFSYGTLSVKDFSVQK